MPTLSSFKDFLFKYHQINYFGNVSKENVVNTFLIHYIRSHFTVMRNTFVRLESILSQRLLLPVNNIDSLSNLLLDPSTNKIKIIYLEPLAKLIFESFSTDYQRISSKTTVVDSSILLPDQRNFYRFIYRHLSEYNNYDLKYIFLLKFKDLDIGDGNFINISAPISHLLHFFPKLFRLELKIHY
jgi:hypothetical protein